MSLRSSALRFTSAPDRLTGRSSLYHTEEAVRILNSDVLDMNSMRLPACVVIIVARSEGLSEGTKFPIRRTKNPHHSIMKCESGDIGVWFLES